MSSRAPVCGPTTLPYFFENDDVRVVHAALVPGIPLAGQRAEILCGSTAGEKALAALFPDGYWHDYYTDAKPVVFGHHVTGPQPMMRDGRVFGLDTGACHGGNLTVLVLPGCTVHAVPARADHWAATRRAWQLPVLKTRPWLDMTWEDLSGTAIAYAARGDAETRDWLAELQAWAAGLRDMFPAMVAAANRLAGGLPPERMRRHPAAPLLFQARAGGLGEDGVARKCRTPRRALVLAADLGLVTRPVPDVSDVPGVARDDEKRFVSPVQLP